MIEDKKNERRQRIFHYCLIAILIFILFASFVASVIVIPVVATNRRVASAIDSSLPEDGVVGDNLLIYSNSSSLQLSNASWHTNNVNLIDGVISNNRSDSNATLCFLLDFPNSSSFTLSCSVSSLNGIGRIGLANYSNGALSNYDYINFSSDGIQKISHVYNNYNCVVLRNNTPGSSFKFNWLKLEVGSFFTGYVPNSYVNYGYDQGINSGYDKGFIDGLNKYVDNHAISSNLNVDSYISTGGFSFLSSLTSPNVNYNILNASKVENYTRTSSQTIASPYDALKLDINYNLIYSQGSFSTSSNKYTGGAGYYGVKSSLIGSNAFNSFINAGTPFSLNCVSARRSVWDNAIYGRDYALFVCFLDKDGNILRFSDLYSDAYYLDSVPFSYNTNMRDGIFIYDTLTSGDLHYYRLPVDVYGFILFSEYEDTDVFRAYSMKCNFLPNSDYQSIYDSGFKAGQSDINTGAYYDNGYNIGYQQGVIKGASEANNYTFLGVIGSIIDAPLNSLLALLDFDLLGFNMRGFFSALLMLSFIILIIRLLLGGK